MPVEAFLAGYSDPIRDTAEALRGIVRQAVPDAIERVRSGWRLIGYDVPVGKRSRYFAFIWLEPVHVHIGYEYGVWMDDPEQVMEGAHLRLRKVRYLTFEPGQPIPEAALIDLTREGARVAAMSATERVGRTIDRDWEPDQPVTLSQRRVGC